MMMSSFFITGTDTNVGKTIVTRAIMQALQKVGIQVVGYKPIAFGQDEPIYSLKSLQEESDYETKDNSDVLTLMNSTRENVTYEEVNSYTFLHTIPILTEESQRVKIEKLNADLARLSTKYSSVAVEGAFGWLTPINKDYSFADWVAEHNMPTIVVVGIKEGCINHALLTVQSILSKNLPLLGWVANRINPGLGHYAEIIETLKQKIDAPLLGEIAYIHRPEEQDLSHFITGLECVIVPFMTALIFKNKITIFAIFGALIAIFGLWLLSGATLALGSGEALALLCAIFYALYTSLNGHFVRKCELYLLVFVVFLTVSLLSFVFAFIEGSVAPNYDREFFIAIFITAFIGTIFCYFVQTIAQRYTTASKAALFFCLEPVSAGLIGYFFAGEILSIWQIFGAMLIIFGVIFSEFGKQICSKFKL